MRSDIVKKGPSRAPHRSLFKAAWAFVKLASKYKCNITIAANGKEINDF